MSHGRLLSPWPKLRQPYRNVRAHHAVASAAPAA